MRTKNLSYAHAFSLTELLIVIAILAVMAAILLPVFFQTREKSRAASCLTSEKNIAIAIRGYLDDNDGYWFTTLYAFRFFQERKCNEKCPSFQPPPQNATVADFMRSMSYTPLGYAFGTGVVRGGFLAPGFPVDPPVQESKVRYPTLTVCLAEVNGNDAIPVTGWMSKKDWGTRHNGGSNFLFCDGHAKWYSPAAISDIDDIKGSDGAHLTFDALTPPIKER